MRASSPAAGEDVGSVVFTLPGAVLGERHGKIPEFGYRMALPIGYQIQNKRLRQNAGKETPPRGGVGIRSDIRPKPDPRLVAILPGNQASWSASVTTIPPYQRRAARPRPPAQVTLRGVPRMTRWLGWVPRSISATGVLPALPWVSSCSRITGARRKPHIEHQGLCLWPAAASRDPGAPCRGGDEAHAWA